MNITSINFEIGKKGSEGDITFFYHSKELVFIKPKESIKSLLASLAISQYVVIRLNRNMINKQFGELILILNSIKKDGCFILEDVSKEELQNYIKGTYLENYKIFKDSKELIDFLLQYRNNLNKEMDSLLVPIDQYFEVKGVGLVLLGTVLKGKVEVYKKYKIQPLNKEILIKSIQVHDENVKEAIPYYRVGLAVKGVERKELYRGIVVGDVKKVKEIEGELIKNPFYKESIPKKIMAAIGLQYVSCTLENNKLVFDKEVALYGNILLVNPNGKVKFIGKFTYK